MFDSEGACIGDIASYGERNGQALLPKALCIVNDTLYVSDDHRIGIFTRQAGKNIRVKGGSCGSLPPPPFPPEG
ncbi:MAG: hypothetical protein AB2L14_33680 [Candidatus Xenobiia bacterium LiM19]